MMHFRYTAQSGHSPDYQRVVGKFFTLLVRSTQHSVPTHTHIHVLYIHWGLLLYFCSNQFTFFINFHDFWGGAEEICKVRSIWLWWKDETGGKEIWRAEKEKRRRCFWCEEQHKELRQMELQRGHSEAKHSGEEIGPKGAELLGTKIDTHWLLFACYTECYWYKP